MTAPNASARNLSSARFITLAMSTPTNFSSAIRKILTPTIPAKSFRGFAAARSAENPSLGGARVTAGAISISKRIRKTESPWIGRSATRTLRRGTTTWKSSPASAARPKACRVCHRGCIAQSYFSSLNSTLPAAQKTGRFTIRPYSVVHSLVFDPQTRRVSSVRVIDAQTKNALEFKARVFFICASTLESTRILLNSATPEFPDGLANSSGELGHNLMDHHMGAGAGGELPGHEDKVPLGNRPNGIYIPRFRNVNAKTKQKDFVRGYGYQGGGSREGWSRGMYKMGLGVDFKNMLRMPGPWRMGMGGFGECLPNHNNYVEIDKEKLDAWSIPTLKIHCDWSENELATYRELTARACDFAVSELKKNNL